MVIVLAAGLSACSGGSQHVVPTTQTATSAPTTTSLKISIPHATAAPGALRRTPAYISASTQSITINVKPHGSGTSVSGYPITANLTATSTGCSSTITATVCNVTLTLAAGNYDATLTTFDLANGAGNQLSAAQSMPLTVAEGQANVVGLALGGIPASVQILASGGQVAAGQGFVFTLPAAASGSLSVFGVDAGGNTIVGAGAPAIGVTTSDATQINVTAPTAGAPNAVGVTAVGSNEIAHVTMTVTPVAGTGTSAVTRTITVQAPTRNMLYLVAGSRIRVFDATGFEVTKSGTAFDSLPPTVVGATYDPANGLIYVSYQTSSGFVLAYDRNGNAQPLGAGATNLGSNVRNIVFDPANGLLYFGSGSVALDAAGNQVLLSGTIAASYGLAYDPTNNVIISGTTTYNANGTTHGSFPFTSQFQAVTYNPFNGYLYEASVYPTGVEAFATSGAQQSVPGPWINGASEQIAAIGADPSNGNVFFMTNGNNTYGFDLNGNSLGLPWHDLIGIGAPGDVGGVLLLPPQ